MSEKQKASEIDVEVIDRALTPEEIQQKPLDAETRNRKEVVCTEPDRPKEPNSWNAFVDRVEDLIDKPDPFDKLLADIEWELVRPLILLTHGDIHKKVAGAEIMGIIKRRFACYMMEERSWPKERIKDLQAIWFERAREKASALIALREIITLCETCQTIGVALQALGTIQSVASKVVREIAGLDEPAVGNGTE